MEKVIEDEDEYEDEGEDVATEEDTMYLDVLVAVTREAFVRGHFDDHLNLTLE